MIYAGCFAAGLLVGGLILVGLHYLLEQPDLDDWQRDEHSV